MRAANSQWSPVSLRPAVLIQAECDGDSVFQDEGRARGRDRNIAAASGQIEIHPDGGAVGFEDLAALVPADEARMTRGIGLPVPFTGKLDGETAELSVIVLAASLTDAT